MSLEEIIAARKAGSAGPPPPSAEPDAGAGRSDGEEPWGVTRAVTPSGLEIYYQAGPKRLYRIYDPEYPEIGEVEVPSVSTVLGVLEKGGLSWWGQGVGASGVMALVDMGELIWVEA